MDYILCHETVIATTFALEHISLNLITPSGENRPTKTYCNDSISFQLYFNNDTVYAMQNIVYIINEIFWKTFLKTF